MNDIINFGTQVIAKSRFVKDHSSHIPTNRTGGN